MLKQSIIATAAMSLVAISQPVFAGCSASGFCYELTSRVENKYWNTREINVYYKEFDKKVKVYIDCKTQTATSFGSVSMASTIAPKRMSDDVDAAIPSICN